ncbi:helix-turn-helix domain-containing protein [Flavobacterium soyae]|uniref:Helix-turn-helix transcriptional regulator n=1 Tax=Flavobacterium soyae TaxID=2903098 RepID=A0ABZ2UF37_9FLAO
MTQDQLKEKIGQRIVELRKEKGWNQSDLARACKKDRQSIERLENGKLNMTIYTLFQVATALDISLSKLVDVS